MKRFVWIMIGSALVVVVGCGDRLPLPDSIKDSKLLDKRIEETPRQKIVRECKQETDRFRVKCTFCHGTDKEDQIQAPLKLQLTDRGKRAQIMRKSPTFGLHTQCTVCHQSKFELNRYAQEQFGPGRPRRAEVDEAFGE